MCFVNGLFQESAVLEKEYKNSNKYRAAVQLKPLKTDSQKKKRLTKHTYKETPPFQCLLTKRIKLYKKPIKRKSNN